MLTVDHQNLLHSTITDTYLENLLTTPGIQATHDSKARTIGSIAIDDRRRINKTLPYVHTTVHLSLYGRGVS